MHPTSSHNIFSSCKEKRIYKMKVVILVFALFAAICSVLAYVPPVQRPVGVTQPFPTFPGHGPFNPKIQWPYPMPNPRY